MGMEGDILRRPSVWWEGPVFCGTALLGQLNQIPEYQLQGIKVEISSGEPG